MKKIFRAVGLLLVPIGPYLSAQHQFNVSLDAGYTTSTLNANLSNLIDSRYKSRSGFGVNLSGEYMIWKSLFVSTGVGLHLIRKMGLL